MLARASCRSLCRVILSLLVGVLVLGGVAHEAHAQRNVSEQRECATCHVMWLKDFNRKDVTPLIPYDPKPTVSSGKQDVASTERMCFSCHDGFVLDSRPTWVNRHNLHPVGVKPSDKVKIPTKDGKPLFPLNDDGKTYCGTCHTAHGVEWGDKISPIFLRARNTNSSLCMACHLERGTGPAEGNHPVLKQLKEVPDVLRAAGSRFADGTTVVCESCHRVHGAPDKKLLVMRNENSELCGTCHADRYAKDLAQAGAMGTHPVNIRPIKVKVPQDLLDKGAKLGGESKIICQTCHRPHFAQNNAKLLIAPNPQSELCRTCHLEQRKVANTKHNIALVDESAKNSRGREVGQAGVCSACHLPHGGSGPKMWARQVKPGGGDPMADLCQSCHREGGLAEKKLVGSHSHPTGRDMARLKTPVELPGYSREGIKTIGTERGMVTCASCHDPHQWDPSDPDKASRPGDPSDASNKFLRKPNGADSELCRTCHKNKDGIKNTKHDMSVMFPQERNIKGQTPSDSGTCGTCHVPHNAKGPRMWARDLMPGVDAVSSTCLSCHNPRGLAKDKQIGSHSHPVNVPISNIGITAKDGKWASDKPLLNNTPALQALPLFDSQGVPIAEGGNVACGTCHDPHNWSVVSRTDAGKDPRTVTGNGDSSFLRLPNDNKATLCGNCHVDKAAITLSKHNLAISAQESKNSKGRTPAETGACGACHLPHNGSGSKMWAQTHGPGKDEIERKCSSCHQEGHVAGKKLTGINSHPLGVDLKNIGGETSLPLYTAEGKRDNTNGKVSCATCHDPHQWKPRDTASTAGARPDVEGTAADSFLRLPAAPQSELCINCHQDKRWVKNTEHDLGITAPNDTNDLNQVKAQSGVCGSCHVPHNAREKVRLWARPMGKGSDAMEGLCRSCHSLGKVAAAKQPLMANHPPAVMAVSTPSARHANLPGGAYFPVFTKDGQKAGAGAITCPTCHNPHQWSARKAEEGPGKNTEGNALSSFLRNTSESAICTNCHGLDALFRYKFFHAETSRDK